jgi:hypothetical protein
MRAIPVTDRARTNNPSIVAPRLQASYCVVTRTLAISALAMLITSLERLPIIELEATARRRLATPGLRETNCLPHREKLLER